METQETKDKTKTAMKWWTYPLTVVLIITCALYTILVVDMLHYIAPNVRGACFLIVLVGPTTLLCILVPKIPKVKQNSVWMFCLCMIPYLLTPLILGTNYAWSDPETRHMEQVTVKEYSYARNDCYMTVEYEDGWQREILMDEERYKIGTTLPVTIERGLFGIDVIVEWGFENDEYTVILPNYPKYKGNNNR